MHPAFSLKKAFLTVALLCTAGLGRHEQANATSSEAGPARDPIETVATPALDCHCVTLAPEGKANVETPGLFAEIVIDAKTGDVLSEKNADTRLYPASLTKMMTLYLTFADLRDGRLTMDQVLTASDNAAAQKPSSLGLEKGDTITVEDAILALTVHSANDVAVVIAEAQGDDFICRMNAQACALGMNNTHFANPSGLPKTTNHPDLDHFSTVRDMATLSQALMRDFPAYYHYFGVKTFTWNHVTYSNHNKLMSQYAGMDGLKTGYISASGYNLAASAVHGDTRLIGVVFGGHSGKSRDAEMKLLLDQGFAKVKKEQKPKVASVRPS